MNAEEFRAAALTLPGAVEAAHMNHPDFRVNGRIFASLGYPDESWGMVKLTPAQQLTFIKKASGAFKPCNGVWGERGAANVHLASATRKILSEALNAALQNIISPVKKNLLQNDPAKPSPSGQTESNPPRTNNITKP